jgi:hypothetical protein
VSRSTTTCTFWISAASIGSSTIVDGFVSSRRRCASTPWRANVTIAVAGTTSERMSSFATSPGRYSVRSGTTANALLSAIAYDGTGMDVALARPRASATRAVAVYAWSALGWNGHATGAVSLRSRQRWTSLGGTVPRARPGRSTPSSSTSIATPRTALPSMSVAIASSPPCGPGRGRSPT